MDPFHVVQLATDALDEIRREVCNEARKAGQTAVARGLRGTRFALWKNHEHLTRRRRARLSSVQQTNERLYGAYLLKEQLREIYRVPAEHAGALLDAWLAWARRSRLEPFVKLARTITEQRPGIEAAIEHGLSNALSLDPPIPAASRHRGRSPEPIDRDPSDPPRGCAVNRL